MPADSTPLLVELTAKGDGVVAYLSADLLIAIGPGARAPVAARCSDPSASVRRRMVELWGKLPAGETPIPTAEWERLGALARHDPEWLVRGEAQSSLASIGAQQQNKGFVAGILRQGLADPDLAVAQKAAEGFGVLGEPRAIPWLIDGLIPLERKGAAAAVKAGRKSLEALSGERRDRSLAEWQEWWDRIGSRR
jgi:HEAT repeat protein